MRAARLQEEHQAGNLILRYCPTLSMAADAMTKMGNSTMLDNLRNAMNAKLPEVPEADSTVKASDDSWWAAGVLGHDFSRARENEHYFLKLKARMAVVSADTWWHAKALYLVASAVCFFTQ